MHSSAGKPGTGITGLTGYDKKYIYIFIEGKKKKTWNEGMQNKKKMKWVGWYIFFVL